MTAWDAVVLAGGTGERLGGVDKSTIVVGGRPTLSRVLDAVSGAAIAVVVGDVVVPDGVLRVVEDPPHGGPAAGLGAALPHLRSPWVLLLGCDLPFAAGAVPALLDAAAADGVVAVDPDGRRQLVCSLLRTAALRDAAAAVGPLHGVPLRRLLAPLDLVEVPLDARSVLDLDTWHDVREAGGGVDG